MKDDDLKLLRGLITDRQTDRQMDGWIDGQTFVNVELLS